MMARQAHTGIVYAGELLDWGFNWTDAIPSGDTIADSSWTYPDGIVVAKEVLSGATTSTWLTGFTATEIYDVTNHVTLTPSGRKFDQTLTLYCLASSGDVGIVVSDAVDTDGNQMVWSDGSSWVFVERS